MTGITKETEILAVPAWGVNIWYPPPDFNLSDGDRIQWPINTVLVVQEQKKLPRDSLWRNGRKK